MGASLVTPRVRKSMMYAMHGRLSTNQTDVLCRWCGWRLCWLMSWHEGEKHAFLGSEQYGDENGAGVGAMQCGGVVGGMGCPRLDIGCRVSAQSDGHYAVEG